MTVEIFRITRNVALAENVVNCQINLPSTAYKPTRNTEGSDGPIAQRQADDLRRNVKFPFRQTWNIARVAGEVRTPETILYLHCFPDSVGIDDLIAVDNFDLALLKDQKFTAGRAYWLSRGNLHGLDGGHAERVPDILPSPGLS